MKIDTNQPICESNQMNSDEGWFDSNWYNAWNHQSNQKVWDTGKKGRKNDWYKSM